MVEVGNIRLRLGEVKRVRGDAIPNKHRLVRPPRQREPDPAADQDKTGDAVEQFGARGLEEPGAAKASGNAPAAVERSEERRVGKERRSRWLSVNLRQNTEANVCDIAMLIWNGDSVTSTRSA